jgi:hypothetical protein
MSHSKKRVARKKGAATMRPMQNVMPDNFVDSRDFARIARAIRFIDEHFREQPRLDDGRRTRACPSFTSTVCSAAGLA